MRILITGGLGQLGRALQQVLTGHTITIVDLPDTDITNKESIKVAVQKAEPELIIHCAAYTDVDDCARNPELAFRINALGTQNVALACRQIGADLVHISTNEVFAGERVDGYEEWMPVDPINVYGRSKAAGEYYVKNMLDSFYIIRTAWLYAPGGRNFIHAILNKAQSQGEVRVVVDEIGNPTYVADLANAIGLVFATGQFGTYHLTNSGACSRWAFANKIVKLAGLEGVQVVPILSREFKRASTPPPFGALSNIAGASIGITLRPWEAALTEYIDSQELGAA